MINKLLCLKTKMLLDAIETINKNAKGATFIVDDDRKLYGVLTDGDIRRLILDGHSLQTPIDQLLDKNNVVYAKHNETHEEILEKFDEKVVILPVVNDDFQVIDYFEFRKEIRTPLISPDLKGNELKYLMDACLSTWISSSGQYVDQFESNFAEFCECQYGLAVSNGTAAIHLALLACGVGSGDEVIIPDLTFAATINPIIHCGAKPVLVDVEPNSWCIDPDEIEKAITPKTKAIIPVHLYGQPCDMDRIMAIAQKHNLFVIEDCAEAHGAEYKGKKVGSFGDINCFSFFGNKIITTGEGGMCVTNSKEFDEKMRILRDHGMNKTKRYWHDVVGFNYRLTNLQAAVGVAQLERIEEILENRKKVEEMYREKLEHFSLIEFQKDDLPNRKKITWLVSVLINDGKRDEYLERLKKEGIDTRSLFFPLSQMDIYKEYVFSNKVSQDISRRGMSFPTGTDLNPEVLEIMVQIFSEEMKLVVK